MFTIDLRTIYRGLDSLFLLKSVPFSAIELKLPCAQLRSWFNLRPNPAFHIVYSFIPSPKVPVHILHLGNIVNHVFEDLRKMKAPNTPRFICPLSFIGLLVVLDCYHLPILFLLHQIWCSIFFIHLVDVGVGDFSCCFFLLLLVGPCLTLVRLVAFLMA
jgi:hypothetical protein